MSEPSSSSQPSSEPASLSDAQFIQAMRQQQEVTQRLLREQSAGIDRLQALVMENCRALSCQVVRLEHKVEQQKAMIERLEKLLWEADKRQAQFRIDQMDHQLTMINIKREQNQRKIQTALAMRALLDRSSFGQSDRPPPPPANSSQQSSCASARSAAASRNIAATRPAAGQATAASGRGRRARSSASTTPRRTQQPGTVAAAADQVVDAATGSSASEQ